MTLGKSLNSFKPVIYEVSGLDPVTSEVPDLDAGRGR